jgi:hypothetical protein
MGAGHVESFSIGRTLSRAFGLITSTLPNVGLFLLLVQLLTAAIQFVSQQLTSGAVATAEAGGDPAAALAIFTSGWYWVATLFSLASGSFAFAGSLYGFIQTDEGHSVSLGDCIRVGLAKLLPVLGLTILWYLGIIVGWMALFVPGMILIAMWSAAMPALVNENLGVTASFSRSRQLTKGSRMMIFILLIVVLVLLYAVIFGVSSAILGGGIAGIGIAISSNPWLRLGTIPFGWLFSITTSALLVSIYLETVTIKEGATSGKLDDIFG